MELPAPEIGQWMVVEHGTVTLHDADALSDTDIPALADQWYHTLTTDKPHPFGCGNLPLPDTKRCNIVFSRSGWGDGLFPVLATIDASGRPNAIHIDFGVVGTEPVPSHMSPKRLAATVRRMLRSLTGT